MVARVHNPLQSFALHEKKSRDVFIMSVTAALDDVIRGVRTALAADGVSLDDGKSEAKVSTVLQVMRDQLLAAINAGTLYDAVVGTRGTFRLHGVCKDHDG